MLPRPVQCRVPIVERMYLLRYLEAGVEINALEDCRVWVSLIGRVPLPVTKRLRLIMGVVQGSNNRVRASGL